MTPLLGLHICGKRPLHGIRKEPFHTLQYWHPPMLELILWIVITTLKLHMLSFFFLQIYEKNINTYSIFLIISDTFLLHFIHTVWDGDFVMVSLWCVRFTTTTVLLFIHRIVWDGDLLCFCDGVRFTYHAHVNIFPFMYILCWWWYSLTCEDVFTHTTALLIHKLTHRWTDYASIWWSLTANTQSSQRMLYISWLRWLKSILLMIIHPDLMMSIRQEWLNSMTSILWLCMRSSLV